MDKTFLQHSSHWSKWKNSKMQNEKRGVGGSEKLEITILSLNTHIKGPLSEATFKPSLENVFFHWLSIELRYSPRSAVPRYRAAAVWALWIRQASSIAEAGAGIKKRDLSRNCDLYLSVHPYQAMFEYLQRLLQPWLTEHDVRNENNLYKDTLITPWALLYSNRDHFQTSPLRREKTLKMKRIILIF